MKRRRNSTASNGARRNREAGEISHVQISCSGPSLSDLPDSILVNVLLRLSIKRIFVCKCVCKTWFDLISDSDFAKLHLDQAQVYPLIRTKVYTLLSRILYLVQPEHDDFEGKLDKCYDNSPIKIKLDSKLTLPLRNIEMLLDNEGVVSKNCLKLNMKNHGYKIVNSCNGLLCLSNPSDNEPVVVCNPITGEFINLPEVRTVSDDPKRPSVECGFGFNPVTNQYKVIRMFMRWTHGVTRYDKVIVAEVHTLGTESWRVLPVLPNTTYMSFPTYLNGCIYWFSYANPHSVISFDVEKERFESISVLEILEHFYTLETYNMGVLGRELFISLSGLGDICVWVMKGNGANKSWSQIFSVQNDDDDDDDDRLPYHGSYKPIKYLNNGALLMFNSDEHALIYKDPRKTGFRYLKVRGCRSEFEVIAHIPSFVPLVHALSGHNVKVFNINSRCAGLKLHGEDKGISIVEENRKV